MDLEIHLPTTYRLRSHDPFPRTWRAERIGPGLATLAHEDTVLGGDRPRNARGVIAEHYYDLQSLGLVERARFERDFEHASDLSLLRTVLQACEIGLYNLADLLRRAAEDRAGCATKLAWCRGFHRVLVGLTGLGSVFTAASGRHTGPAVRPGESPAFVEYLEALKGFDRSVRRRVATGEFDVHAALAGESLPGPAFAIMHLARIGNHEATIWERSLRATAVPDSSVAYAELVASATLREAVYEHRLTGDTYFTQFRALHQIPELLAAEMNDRLEAAILALREGRVAAALEELVWINALTRPAAACLPAMVDNLATSDYHEIRENLGLTSGSHSVGIRYHLFTDLYEQLCEAVAGCGAAQDGPLADLVRAELSSFRGFVFGWRDAHLHLPRNNLGGNSTRSLTGSPDAVSVVRRMAEHARSKDPARALLTWPAGDEGELGAYLSGGDSLDRLLLDATGDVTQSKFVDVQERLGFFSDACPFTKPPRREV